MKAGMPRDFFESYRSARELKTRRWTENGLNLWAVSDFGADELTCRHGQSPCDFEVA